MPKNPINGLKERCARLTEMLAVRLPWLGENTYCRQFMVSNTVKLELILQTDRLKLPAWNFNCINNNFNSKLLNINIKLVSKNT